MDYPNRNAIAQKTDMEQMTREMYYAITGQNMIVPRPISKPTQKTDKKKIKGQVKKRARKAVYSTISPTRSSL
jgi:hypothetical protein